MCFVGDWRQSHYDALPLFHIALVLAVLPGLGCGKAGPTRLAISGNVILDGVPLPSGTITLIPATAEPAVVATIREGRFDIPRKAGPYAGQVRVDVQAHRDLGFPIDDEAAYAALAAISAVPPSPHLANIVLRDNASPEMVLGADRQDVRIELVSVILQ